VMESIGFCFSGGHGGIWNPHRKSGANPNSCLHWGTGMPIPKHKAEAAPMGAPPLRSSRY